MLRKHRLPVWLQLLVAAIAVSVVAAWPCGTAVAAEWHPHELPVVYRARLFNADVTKTAAACAAALERDGYQVVVADSLAGIVYTAGKVVAPASPEIGGEWQITCFFEIRAVQGKSLVTAELLAEGRGVGGNEPIAYDLQSSRRLYEELFRLVRAELKARSERGP